MRARQAFALMNWSCVAIEALIHDQENFKNRKMIFHFNRITIFGFLKAGIGFLVPLFSGTLTCQPRVLTVSASATTHHQGCHIFASLGIVNRIRNRKVDSEKDWQASGVKCKCRELSARFRLTIFTRTIKDASNLRGKYRGEVEIGTPGILYPSWMRQASHLMGKLLTRA